MVAKLELAAVERAAAEVCRQILSGNEHAVGIVLAVCVCVWKAVVGARAVGIDSLELHVPYRVLVVHGLAVGIGAYLQAVGCAVGDGVHESRSRLLYDEVGARVHVVERQYPGEYRLGIVGSSVDISARVLGWI